MDVWDKKFRGLLKTVLARMQKKTGSDNRIVSHLATTRQEPVTYGVTAKSLAANLHEIIAGFEDKMHQMEDMERQARLEQAELQRSREQMTK